MSISRFSFPTTIHFGVGARKLVGAHLRDAGCKRALIVTDKGLAALPLIAELKADLEAAGWRLVRWVPGDAGATLVARVGRALYLGRDDARLRSVLGA